MKRALLGAMVLAAGLSLAQGVDYRQEAMAAMALARLQTVAQQATGEEKLLAWAKEVKARTEKSYEAKEAFKALRQAQAALAPLPGGPGGASPPGVSSRLSLRLSRSPGAARDGDAAGTAFWR
jgi:hypothetical protein